MLHPSIYCCPYCRRLNVACPLLGMTYFYDKPLVPYLTLCIYFISVESLECELVN